MASLAQLQTDVLNWLNRQDPAASGAFASWVTMAELEIAETLRARCMLESATQNIDAPIITLPPDFATMESIRDNTSGELFELKDEWSGHWNTIYYQTPPVSAYGMITPANVVMPCMAYRLVENCIEFLPHPQIPNPPDANWVPQQCLMRWYAKPAPLLLPTDTNAVLEALYSCYLFGVLKYGAIWALDDPRAQQMDQQWQAVITRANLWKQQSDYSGAPFRAELATRF